MAGKLLSDLAPNQEELDSPSCGSEASVGEPPAWSLLIKA